MGMRKRNITMIKYLEYGRIRLLDQKIRQGRAGVGLSALCDCLSVRIPRPDTNQRTQIRTARSHPCRPLTDRKSVV